MKFLPPVITFTMKIYIKFIKVECVGKICGLLQSDDFYFESGGIICVIE